jgi:ribosome-associated toxin RatA of RatAB toxin-antitoxin module
MENYTQLTISFNDLKEISYNSHVLMEHTEEGYKITSICKESPLKYLKSAWIIKKQN